MRNRSNIVLIAVLVLVAGVAYWLALNPEVGQGADDLTPTPFGGTSARLWDVDAADISAFEIVDTSDDSMARLERGETAAAGEEQWIITAPVESLADQERVRAAVSGLANLMVTRTLLDVTDIEPYGVRSPGYVLRVFTSGSDTPLVAMVGNENPGGSAYYVLRQGEQHVVMVGKAGIDALTEFIDTPPYQPTPTPGAPRPATESGAEPSPQATTAP